MSARLIASQGGLALAVLAVCAQLFDAVCMHTLGASLSATSLLIIVGTVMQSSRQVGHVLHQHACGLQHIELCLWYVLYCRSSLYWRVQS